MILQHLRSLHLARFQAEPADFCRAGPREPDRRTHRLCRGLCDARGDRLRHPGGHLAALRRQDCPLFREFRRSAPLKPRLCRPRRSKHWSDYPLGVVAILAGEGHAIPGFSLTLVGRCAAGFRTFQLRCGRGGDGAGRHFALGVSYPGPVLARLCQRAENEFVGAKLRHHGPVHLGQRRREPRPAAGLPRSEFQTGADSAQRGAGHRQHHGETCGDRRGVHQPTRRKWKRRRRDCPPPAGGAFPARRHRERSGAVGRRR